MTPAEKAELAQRLVPVAQQLAGLVRDASPHDIEQFLQRFTEQERLGLLVVLAAMVPMDTPVDQLLAWVTWDWDGHGHPATAA